jgi:hypothetical protein
MIAYRCRGLCTTFPGPDCLNCEKVFPETRKADYPWVGWIAMPILGVLMWGLVIWGVVVMASRMLR